MFLAWKVNMIGNSGTISGVTFALCVCCSTPWLYLSGLSKKVMHSSVICQRCTWLMRVAVVHWQCDFHKLKLTYPFHCYALMKSFFLPQKLASWQEAPKRNKTFKIRTSARHCSNGPEDPAERPTGHRKEFQTAMVNKPRTKRVQTAAGHLFLSQILCTQNLDLIFLGPLGLDSLIPFT